MRLDSDECDDDVIMRVELMMYGVECYCCCCCCCCFFIMFTFIHCFYLLIHLLIYLIERERLYIYTSFFFPH